MSTDQPAAECVATKDLIERYTAQRVSARWAAFYMVATTVLILAWSRSPSWAFKLPFEMFVREDKPLSVPSAFAPIFGPFIEMFFYYNFFVVSRECLALGRVLDGRLARSRDERPLLTPPFETEITRPVDAFVTWLMLPGTLLLSTMLLGDFLGLTYDNGNHSVWRLLHPLHWDNVTPVHRGHGVGGTLVYGVWQPWLYVLFLLFKILVVVLVLWDTWAYCRTLRCNGRPPSGFATWLGARWVTEGARDSEAQGGKAAPADKNHPAAPAS